MFHKVIAHGMWGGALISTLLGTKLPGPGTIYLNQTLKFLAPVGLGDTVTATVSAVEKTVKHHVMFDCSVCNQRGEVVITGRAEVIAPTEKISRQRIVMPEAIIVEKSA
jgi:acyl dehydratase